jgi:membrane associated rhomboid family serine protease
VSDSDRAGPEGERGAAADVGDGRGGPSASPQAAPGTSAGALDQAAVPPDDPAPRTNLAMNDPASPQLPSRALVPVFPAPRGAPPRSFVAPGDDDASLPGLVALGPVASERKARDWALVLQSMSIWHAIRRSNAGWVLLVNDAEYAQAARSIDHYEAENRDWPPRPARERTRHPSSVAIPVVFALLAAFFLVTGPVAGGSFWFDRGIAESSRVLGSQPWRAVTALTLHADAVHVMGNAISGTVFVSAVQRRLGAGGALLAVLASGIAGNVANAAYHHLTVGHHSSLGASTAVFGAIGVLAATQLVLDRPAADGAARATSGGARRWLEAAAPIVGGFALLGALGAGGERTDLGAHLFGFLSGVLIGLGVAFPLRRATLAVHMATGRHGHEVSLGTGAPRWWVQTTLGALAAGIVMVSWQLALR